MKKKIGLIGALLASLSCVKVETTQEAESYNSILEYAVNSKDAVNHILLGPVEISPLTWDDIDSECYVQIDNERILIINRTDLFSGKQRVKQLVLHYLTKEDIANDFNKFAEDGINYFKKSSFNVTAAELMSTDLDNKVNIDFNNISIDFIEDNFGKEFYYLSFKTELDSKNEFIIIPAEFV